VNHQRIPPTADGDKTDIKESKMLQTTPTAIGGMRWWFTCALLVSGRSCGRRVSKLCLPPGSRYFGCRRCHDLTYASCQESHKYDRLFRSLADDTGIDERLVKSMFARR